MSGWLRHGLLAILVLLLAACAAGPRPAPIVGLAPAEPQPTAQQLAPGLAVQYTYGVMNQLIEMKGRKFVSGPPIAHLDWDMGSGIVLTSKAREEVGAIITGFVRLDRVGIYGFNVTSNDGVRLEIGGALLHENPGVHPDTTSETVDVDISRPGWYPIRIVYFQKHNTATLVVRWVVPVEPGRPVPIPGSALAHLT